MQLLTGLSLAVLSAGAAFQTPAPAGPVRAWEKQVAPGVTYYMEADFGRPLTIHALKWAPQVEAVSLKTELGGGGVFASGGMPARESVSAMAARTGALGGVNGDFFPASGDPLGFMLSRGELVSRPWPGRSFAAWGPGGGLVTGRGGFSGQAKGPGGWTAKVEGLNEEALESRIVLNRPAAGAATLRDAGVHVVLEMPGVLAPNGSLKGRVLRISEEKSLPLGTGESSLSGSGAGAENLKKLKPGDEVTVAVQTTGLDLTGKDEAIAGGPVLMRNGSISVENAEEGFRAGFDTDRHPRTAIGRTPLGEVWLVVVDGRQPRVSRGATLLELAGIMARLGCVEAINLDGGGSSEIAFHGLTLNRPSDGQPRAVANGALFYGPAPAVTEESLVITGKNYLTEKLFSQYKVQDSRGQEVPNGEILWSAQGRGWIDQGGFLRWLGEGEVIVRAFVRGQLLSVRVMAEPAERPAAPPNEPRPTGSTSAPPPAVR